MRSSFLVCALILLAACDKGSDPSSGGTDDSGQGDDSGPSKVDADKDGYDSTDDCDDANADVHPGASEVCDEIDNNCVDGIDEGLTTRFYPDTDGDTYGAGTAVEACTQPTGLVENADDCDDTTAAANPRATEVCDGIDNNCAGGVDEGVTTPFYADGDGDGYGAGTATDACAAPTGYVDNPDDCDDTSADAHPGGTEVCDSLDNDCDTDIDDDDSFVTGRLPYWPDADGDGYGDPRVSSTNACEMPSGYVDNADDCDDNDDFYTVYADKYLDADLDGYGEGTTPWYTCYTHRNYVLVGGDCEPYDNGVYPGATEICDEVDNDCNGSTDEDDAGLVYDTWYADADADGYGDDSTGTETCDPVADAVTTGGDCDDSVYLVSPARDEYCDGLDNNCDGAADEVTDYVDWYDDDDGDGYGDDGDVVNDCAPPDGYVLDPGDCDDGDAAVNPGAEEDVCGDDVDADCDGYVDNCNYDIDDAMFSISGNTSNNGVGYSVGSGDVDGDGTDDLLIGAPDAGGGCGAIYLVNGPATGAITVSDVDAKLSGSRWGPGSYNCDRLGSPVTAGDVDGDGYDDVLGGAWRYYGRAYLFLGPITSTTTASADASFDGTATYSGFGDAVALADLDGDGYADTAIGAFSGGTDEGSVHIFMGPPRSSADLIVTGTTMHGYAGMVENVGDVDGDGLDELAQGAYYGGSLDEGEVFLLDPGSTTGTVSASTIATATMTGENRYDTFGYEVAGGDFNGDGYADLFVTALNYDGVGRVYGWLGPVSGAYAGSSADVMVTGDVYPNLGLDLALGDVRGDLAEEVVIGQPYADTYRGRTYLLDGPTTGSIDLSSTATLGGADDVSTYGGRYYLGYAVGTIGDWSGDGADEVIVGNYGIDFGTNSYAGRAWVVSSDDL